MNIATIEECIKIPQDQVSLWRNSLKEERAKLRDEYFARPRPSILLKQHSFIVDKVLKDIWSSLKLPKEIALLATGGYGRMKLFPFSDIDLLILLPRAENEILAQQLQDFIHILWDIGLDVGHSVRTVQECVEEAKKDITVQTNQLETRLIIGSRRLYIHFSNSIRQILNILDFYDAKLLEQQQRHRKYHDTAYNLEPNLKEGPGGLRDLQTIFWIAKAGKIGETWQELAKHDLITDHEARMMAQRETFLNNIRIQLHYHVKRREDRLLFDYQNVLAQKFNMNNDKDQARLPSEIFMQHYYRTAKTIRVLNEILLLNLRNRFLPCSLNQPHVLNPRFQVHLELLDIRDENLFEKKPEAIFETFLLLQKHPELKGYTARTLRALWRSQHIIDRAFRTNWKHKNQFLSLLKNPRLIVATLRRLNSLGILASYIPAFGRIVGQMQHDLFHVYTVDEHTLMVIRNLRRFTIVELDHEFPLCSRLMSEFNKPDVLYIAGLFHDIAKGRGGDHSTLGAKDAMSFCRSHRIPAEDAKLIVWLVEHHLTMSMTAQKKDLSDPQVIQEFASIVHDDRHLIALYLLTVADIRGTSPKVWNAWKAKLLEELFMATRRFLNVQSQQPKEFFSSDRKLHIRTKEAERILKLYAIDATKYHQGLWKTLDNAYFLRHEPHEIAWHTRLLHLCYERIQPWVKCRLSPIGEGIQVMIYTPDQPDLFARICGFFERMKYSIVEAKIYTTRTGYALDSFLVLNPLDRHSHHREMMSYIEFELQESLSLQQLLQKPSSGGRISRHLKHFPLKPDVSIRKDDNGKYHILSISSGDRPGLLSNMSYILVQYGLSVHSAKIVTLGERAEDVFLISGEACRDEKLMLRLQTELLQALQI